jgi:hypothetical protein
LAQNPVFICGAHRSGTTLVRDMLDGHPQLAVLPSEGTYYTNQESKLKALPQNEHIALLGMEWLRRLANPINQPPYWLLGRSTTIGSLYVDFARYLMAWWQEVDRKNKQWPHIAVILAYASCTNGLAASLFVDKTPTNEQFLKRIWREMPNAKIIHVIRNPVDMLLSRKKTDPNFNLRNALRDMRTSFRVAIEKSYDDRFMLVRYEALCDNPKKISRDIAAFLGVENEVSLDIPTVAGLPAQANSSFTVQPCAGQVLKPGQHQQEGQLSKGDLRLLSAYVSHEAVKLNYGLIRMGYLHKLYLRLKDALVFV